MNLELEQKDVQDLGIDTPTITREDAEKWGLLCSEVYKFSCHVRAVLSMPLHKRQQYLEDMKKKHKRTDEQVAEFKAALTYEFNQRKANGKQGR